MPHTWIVWVYAQIVHSHIAIQEMSVAHHPFAFENYHIFNKESEKHFQYVCYLTDSTTNLENISETNNTHEGHCLCIYTKNHLPREVIFKVMIC